MTDHTNLPLASVCMFAGKHLPFGWLMCNGQKIGDKTAFKKYWSKVYEYKFGGRPPHGYTDYLERSFDELLTLLDVYELELPDLRERFILGTGKDHPEVGAFGGEKTVALREEHLPSHSHGGETSDIGSQHEHHQNAFVSTIGRFNPDTNGSGNTVLIPSRKEKLSGGEHTHDFETDKSGGGEAHENQPPYFAAYYIMKVLK
ncbi:MAG: hypothetical protein AAF990_10110 [Bacteroidota bacterium]